ncbi:hypothetical protein [Thalassotalea sediminis]|uniref:hypothetical protein n=1 Tax=Thalassotalea sediminis TaxID=1759089 RepID=UPI00257322B0|nr:hypothetical protein [Thalassotalea sediminis]
MLINNNYADIVTFARQSGATFVDLSKPINTPVSQDTVTLSKEAQDKLAGQETTNVANTYDKPSKSSSRPEALGTSEDSLSPKSQRFNEMMQSILDKRLGIDREKLEEIEAMMKEIANNENLSPEQKQKALEELEKMKEKIIEESLAQKELAKRSFHQDEKLTS